ncbi:MAG: dihydrofolate reductase family protein [Flavobacteriales bacterium]
MKKMNSVFIASSLDGYISDKKGGIDWLHSVPNPNQDDMGYKEFMNRIDALVMGRKTFETVLGFGIDWPYEKPVFVLSNSLSTVPPHLSEKVLLMNGALKGILAQIYDRGLSRLYIDGGSTIQNFLKEDLIDEFILTTIPVLIGGGSRLFSELDKKLDFELESSQVYLNQIVQNRYVRKI